MTPTWGCTGVGRSRFWGHEGSRGWELCQGAAWYSSGQHAGWACNAGVCGSWLRRFNVGPDWERG
ncbi:hypothetical protein BJV77DRAFT_1032142 [Russula vinacea]|nr:hypothetical protein BJV77DRAFT_1032142 [Russula vinacea]